MPFFETVLVLRQYRYPDSSGVLPFNDVAADAVDLPVGLCDVSQSVA